MTKLTADRREVLLGATTLAAASALGSPFAMAPSPANAQTAPGGFPTAEATQKAHDDNNFQRAVTAYQFWYPTVAQEGIFNGNREQGMRDNDSMPIMLVGPHHVGFTFNSDTPYGVGAIDLKDGPWVVELPPGAFMGLINDHHFRWVLDMGLPGPDKGKGGKHLILPPDYQSEVPDEYFSGRSSSHKVLIGIRAFPEKGDVKSALAALRSIKIYPLSTASNPELMKFVDATEKKMNWTVLRWEDNLQYWEKLHEIIDAEPVVPEYRPMYGLLAALGIEKGKPFAPDARMKDILGRATKAGRDQMLVSAYASDRPDRIVWTDRKWEWIILTPDNPNFETPAGMDLEARNRFFAPAYGVSPVMFARKAGSGMVYWFGNRDKDGAFLDGGKTYKLTVPLPAPASLFWSVTVYDPRTRSELQTDQDKAALRSLVELTPEKIGTNVREVDLYFGPTAPQGKADRWIKTTPGKSWFGLFRVYGPQPPTFDGSWKPGDFEEVAAGVTEGRAVETKK